jgi:hypothetical protein
MNRTSGQADLVAYRHSLKIYAQVANPVGKYLKLPKCEIFNLSEFNYYYNISFLWRGDFGTKTNLLKKLFKGSFRAPAFLTLILSLILRRIFLSLGKNIFVKILRSFVNSMLRLLCVRCMSICVNLTPPC